MLITDKLEPGFISLGISKFSLSEWAAGALGTNVNVLQRSLSLHLHRAFTRFLWQTFFYGLSNKGCVLYIFFSSFLWSLILLTFVFRLQLRLCMFQGAFVCKTSKLLELVDVTPEMRGRPENSTLSLKYTINLFGVLVFHAHGLSSILARLAFR